jgi:hypothetical protein
MRPRVQIELPKLQNALVHSTEPRRTFQLPVSQSGQIRPADDDTMTFTAKFDISQRVCFLDKMEIAVHPVEAIKIEIRPATRMPYEIFITYLIRTDHDGTQLWLEERFIYATVTELLDDLKARAMAHNMRAKPAP